MDNRENNMKLWNTDIDKLVSLNVMGWIDDVGPGEKLSYSPDLGFCNPNNVPGYSTDILAAHQMETQIDQTPGLFNEYISALTDILQIPKTGQGFSKGEVWAFMRAKPRQRCLAALEAVGVHPELSRRVEVPESGAHQ